jgi:HD-GYP domain-containing protein (c-di-GMP phosphodiesterase class II)
VGKIGIRDEILLKPSALSREEFEQMKIHPLKGEEIVKPLTFLKEVGMLVRHHHEKYDGTGYPDGLKGEKIELGARILTVADSFDAMVSDRPYRKGMPLEQAVQQLVVNKDKQFDPTVVDAFLGVLNKNPTIVSR